MKWGFLSLFFFALSGCSFAPQEPPVVIVEPTKPPAHEPCDAGSDTVENPLEPIRCVWERGPCSFNAEGTAVCEWTCHWRDE